MNKDTKKVGKIVGLPTDVFSIVNIKTVDKAIVHLDEKSTPIEREIIEVNFRMEDGSLKSEHYFIDNPVIKSFLNKYEEQLKKEYKKADSEVWASKILRTIPIKVLGLSIAIFFGFMAFNIPIVANTFLTSLQGTFAALGSGLASIIGGIIVVKGNLKPSSQKLKVRSRYQRKIQQCKNLKEKQIEGYEILLNAFELAKEFIAKLGKMHDDGMLSEEDFLHVWNYTGTILANLDDPYSPEFSWQYKDENLKNRSKEKQINDRQETPLKKGKEANKRDKKTFNNVVPFSNSKKEDQALAIFNNLHYFPESTSQIDGEMEVDGVLISDDNRGGHSL